MAIGDHGQPTSPYGMGGNLDFAKVDLSRVLKGKIMATKQDHVVPIFSGGLDSTVLVYHLLSLGARISPLSVNYGQRHDKELEFAYATCIRLGLEYKEADLTGITHLISNSSQTGLGDVPEGHYAEESMKQTVVPNRNMIMLAIAGGYAINIKADSIAYGAHAGDHTIYPDCRPEFIHPLGVAMRMADWHAVGIIRPFMAKTKEEIVALGYDLKVPFENTWSCYKGGALHCGKCGTCTERIEAFIMARILDPTVYEHIGRYDSSEKMAAFMSKVQHDSKDPKGFGITN